jgi:hypothetical protein
MMSQFSFDLDNYEMPDSVEVTGCIRTQNMYPISSRDSSIRVIFENLNASCSVQLNVDDHPANWEVAGEVPVSLTLQPNPAGHGYIGENLKVLNRYSSFEHLPFKYVPVREILNSTQKWIDSCPYIHLKAFMYRAIGNPSIGRLFFSIPASMHRHFSEPGGLARHSLEVAQMVYNATACFEEHERWLAAAAGLLHEVGRVRMNIDDSTLKATAGLVCCEVLNFEVLGPALQILEKEWADGAEVIRYMLDSLYRSRKSGPNLPITLSLRSADLMSMANNQRNLAFHDKPKSEVFARIGNSAADLFWQPSGP